MVACGAVAELLAQAGCRTLRDVVLVARQNSTFPRSSNGIGLFCFCILDRRRSESDLVTSVPCLEAFEIQLSHTNDACLVEVES